MKSVISVRASMAKIIIMGLSFSLTTTVLADDVDKMIAAIRGFHTGMAELNEKARAEIPELKKSASKGDTKAQFQLGKYYYYGTGIQQDYVQALIWFSKAAEKDNVEAYFYLGELYALESNVFRNKGYAATAYNIAADLGHKDAESGIINSNLEYEAGRDYYYNADSWLDYRKAFTWMQKAADKGDERAYVYLGAMYQDGKGVSKSDTKAYAAYATYLKVANDKEYDKIGKLKVGEMYYLGQGTTQDYTKAFEWFTKSAAHKNAIAEARLGEMLYQGKGTTKDYAKAFEVYHTATHTILESAHNSAIYGDEEDKKAYEKLSAIGHTNYGDAYAKLSKVGSADDQADSRLELRAKAVKWFKDVCSAGNRDSCEISKFLGE